MLIVRPKSKGEWSALRLRPFATLGPSLSAGLELTIRVVQLGRGGIVGLAPFGVDDRVQRVHVLLDDVRRAQLDEQDAAQPDHDGVVDRADGQVRHDQVGQCSDRQQLEQRVDARVAHQAQDQLHADAQFAQHPASLTRHDVPLGVAHPETPSSREGIIPAGAFRRPTAACRSADRDGIVHRFRATPDAVIVVSSPSASPPYPLSAEKLTRDRWHMAERGLGLRRKGVAEPPPSSSRKPPSPWLVDWIASRALQGGGREGGGSDLVLRKTTLPLAGGLDREPRPTGGGEGGGRKRHGPQETASPPWLVDWIASRALQG